MFKKFKEKLGNWTKNFSEKSEKLEIEEKEISEKEVKKENLEKDIKYSESPLKFDIAKQKYEPDSEKIKEIEKNIEKQIINKEKDKKGFLEKVGYKKFKKIKISEKEFEKYQEDLEMILLENNVALEIAEKIISELKEKITNKEILKKELENEIKDSLKQSLAEILTNPFELFDKIRNNSGPYIILFCGINGTGKTTTIAKISALLNKKAIKNIIAAADTFRAASIEQLEEHGKKINTKIISGNYGADPASIGFDAINYAKKNNIDCVLIDTAGRMHTDKNLLKEIEKISRICSPNLKIFVGESITGNNAIEQVKSFDNSIGIDALILTKADIDEKGGTAISLSYITKKPILFLGTGQKYEALEFFDKEKFLEKLEL